MKKVKKKKAFISKSKGTSTTGSKRVREHVKMFIKALDGKKIRNTSGV